MNSNKLDQVMSALQSLLDALEEARMDFSDVPVLLEVIEESRQEQPSLYNVERPSGCSKVKRS